jgi:hypothetical protein
MNKKTRIFVVIHSILIAFTAAAHGWFEISLGSVPADDILERVGAFSLINNYFYTGIVNIVIAVLIVLWTIFFIHKKFGPYIFLLLSILSVLFGGGIGEILFIILAFIVSFKINSKLKRWQSKSDAVKQKANKLWPPFISLAYVLMFAGIIIWLFVLTPNEIRETYYMHYICWAFLSSGFLLLIVTVFLGFAADSLQREK